MPPSATPAAVAAGTQVVAYDIELTGALEDDLTGTVRASARTSCASDESLEEAATVQLISLSLQDHEPPIEIFFLDDDAAGPGVGTILATVSTAGADDEYVWDGGDPLVGSGTLEWLGPWKLRLDAVLVRVDDGRPLRLSGTLECLGE